MAGAITSSTLTAIVVFYFLAPAGNDDEVQNVLFYLAAFGSLIVATLVLFLCSTIAIINAASRAYAGLWHRYPLTLRLLRDHPPAFPPTGPPAPHAPF